MRGVCFSSQPFSSKLVFLPVFFLVDTCKKEELNLPLIRFLSIFLPCNHYCWNCRGFANWHKCVIVKRMISPFVKNTPGSNAFLTFPCFCQRERVALRSMLGSLLPPTCDTAPFCVLCLDGGVAQSCTARHRWFHWTFQRFSGFLNSGVVVFTFVGQKIGNCHFLACTS